MGCAPSCIGDGRDGVEMLKLSSFQRQMRALYCCSSSGSYRGTQEGFFGSWDARQTVFRTMVCTPHLEL